MYRCNGDCSISFFPRRSIQWISYSFRFCNQQNSEHGGWPSCLYQSRVSRHGCCQGSTTRTWDRSSGSQLLPSWNILRTLIWSYSTVFKSFSEINIHALVQMCFWFDSYFPLLEVMTMYDDEAKNLFKPQHIHSLKLLVCFGEFSTLASPCTEYLLAQFHTICHPVIEPFA